VVYCNNRVVPLLGDRIPRFCSTSAVEALSLIELIGARFFPRRKRRVLMFGAAPVSLPAIPDVLFENDVFRASFMKASEFVAAKRGWSLYDWRNSPEPPPGIERPEHYWTQEVVYQACVFQAIDSKGVEFDAVAGISLGEVPAGHAAGVLSFDDLLIVVSHIIPSVLAAKGGDLIAIPAGADAVRAALGDILLDLILDWPLFSVWALPDEHAKAVHRRLRGSSIAYARLGYNCMSHTHHVDRESLAAGVAYLPYREFTRPYYSTWKGGLMQAGVEGNYWMRMISEPASITGLWNALRRDKLTDVVYIGSVPADRDLFGLLPASERPRKYTRAESLLTQDSTARKPRVTEPSIGAEMHRGEFANDPYSHYKRWRERAPVHHLRDENVWLVLGYDSITSILKQPATFSSTPFAALSPSLFGADPPDHTRVRRILTSYITPDSLLGRRNEVTALIRASLERLRKMESFDVSRDLATPVAMGVAADWLGLNESDAYRFAQIAPSQLTWAEVTPALRDGPGLIRDLASSSDLSAAEVAEFASFLVIAGVATVRDLLMFTLFTLMRNPGLAEEIAADRGLIPSFVDEVLRCEPPVHGLIRRAASPAIIDGTAIPEGAILWLMIAAANRDPAKFDRPDEYVLDRKGPRHLSFGGGIHYCLGSHLGRLQAEIMTDLMLEDRAALTEVSAPQFEFGGLRESQPGIRGMSSWTLTMRR
jgi:cytochrome P450